MGPGVVDAVHVAALLAIFGLCAIYLLALVLWDRWSRSS